MKKPAGRRQKTASATPPKATAIVVTTPGIKATLFRACGPGRRGFAVGAEVRCARDVQCCAVFRVQILIVVTNPFCVVSPGLPGSYFSLFFPDAPVSGESPEFALSRRRELPRCLAQQAPGTLSLESLFCSEVTFGVNYKHAVPFEVKYIPARTPHGRSKLTEYLLYPPAGDGSLLAETMAMNAAGSEFQTCAGLPGAGLTVQRQHRHRDGRGYLRKVCIRG